MDKEYRNCCWGEAKAGMFNDDEAKTNTFDEDDGAGDEQGCAGFMYDWEVTVDSTLKFPCGFCTGALFSRVYIDDSDLVNKGADDRIAKLTKDMNDLKFNGNPQRKKFLSKLSKLGFVSGFKPNYEPTKNEPLRKSDLRSMKYSPPGSSSSSPEPTTQSDFLDVEFKEYNSSFAKKMAKYKLQQSPSLSSISPPLGGSPATSPTPLISHTSETFLLEETVLSSRSSSSTPPSGKANGRDFPLEVNMDDDIFSFLKRRDGEYVAKNANKYMKNDKEVMKYWFQRYRLFSRLNEGILMDRESWFSVTPERLAEHIADRMVRKKGTVILDAFTGAGGNAIQFARRGAFVYAIDLDPIKLRCARQNAKVYGVLDRIFFICADFFDFAKGLKGSRRQCHRRRRGGNKSRDTDKTPTKKDVDERGETPNDGLLGVDAVFLSPPWGGPAYLQSREFDLERDMEPTRGSYIYKIAKEISPNICYFLPRNTSVKQLVALDDSVEIEQAVLNGKVKTLCAYYGNLGAFD